MPGPWEKYKAAESGPWSKYQAGTLPEVREAESLDPQAALSGVGQGLLMGYLPHVQAGVERGTEKLMGLFGAGPEAEDEKLRAQGFKLPARGYLQARDENIARIGKQEKDAPASYYGGLVGGALATAPVMSAAVKPAAGVIGRIAQAGAGGLVQGALQNPGDEAGKLNPIQSDERMGNALTGGGIGLLAGGAGEALSKGAKMFANAPESLGNFAARRSVQAVGFQKSDVNKLTKRLGGVGTKAKMEDLGRYALDKGIVAPGDDIAAMALKIDRARDEIGGALGEAYDSAHAKLTELAKSKSLTPKQQGLLKRTELDPGEIAVKATQYIEKKFKGLAKSQEAANVVTKAAEDLLEVEPNSYSALLRYRKSLDDVLYSKPVASDTPARKALEAYRGFVDKQLNNAVRASDAISGQGLGKTMGPLKAEYKKIMELSAANKNKMAGDLGNNFASLRETIIGAGMLGGGGVGGAVMNPEDMLVGSLKGLALGGAAKAARTYGMPILARGAVGAGRLSAGAKEVAGDLVSRVPGASKLGRYKPGALGTGAAAVGLLQRPKEK